MDIQLSLDQTQQDINHFNLIFILAITTASIFMIIILNILFKKEVIKPIEVLTNKTKDLSEGEGDLRRHIKFVNKDEISKAAY